jgi:hypothetical protein
LLTIPEFAPLNRESLSQLTNLLALVLLPPDVDGLAFERDDPNHLKTQGLVALEIIWF